MSVEASVKVPKRIGEVDEEVTAIVVCVPKLGVSNIVPTPAVVVLAAKSKYTVTPPPTP
jgi:hypothetical protein